MLALICPFNYARLYISRPRTFGQTKHAIGVAAADIGVLRESPDLYLATSG